MPNTIRDTVSQPRERLFGDALSLVEEDERQIRKIQARRAVHLMRAQFEQARPRFIEDALLIKRSFKAEIAALLCITEREAENLIGYSTVLLEAFPSTVLALEAGDVSWKHATVMVDELAGVAAEIREGIEAAGLHEAPVVTPTKLGKMLRLARDRAVPEQIPERHEAARKLRDVELLEDRDGMGGLLVRMPSVQAHAIFNRLTDAAHGIDGPLEQRTLAQRRADIFMHVMLAEVDGQIFGVVPDEFDDENFVKWFRGIKAEVAISVPVLNLLGQSDEPATLDGWVPIDPETARVLAGRATSFIRILTHPETGATLSVGRDRYRATVDMRRAIQIRDNTCRFPGCSQAADRSDLDHIHEYQDGGETSLANLHALCPGHHTLKSTGAWTVVAHADGSETWTTPSGRTYDTFPQHPLAS